MINVTGIAVAQGLGTARDTVVSIVDNKRDGYSSGTGFGYGV